ncbi:glycoside hydrolase family 88 protein [Cohnella soli]|uniref:Glycoside hydrolase family 88 protein n=1 Tax=Cohnella soli TaxID=425005 RepID=A0ABW0I336_9BACL
MVYVVASACVLLLVAAIVIIDIVPIAREWLGRIHIGRYADRERWGSDVTKRGLGWLNRTPTIRATDNTRFIALDMLRGNYAKRAIQHWQEASLLLGLAETTDSSPGKDEETRREIKAFLAAKFDEQGRWLHQPQYVDASILAYAVLKLPDAADTYRAAMDETWALIREHIGADGTVLYRKGMANYRYVDTIGFICPFLVRYGLTFNHPECVELAVRQIREYAKQAMPESLYVPFHAYQVSTGYPLGLYGWGRGLGWFAIGLADAWNELPDSHELKPELEATVVRFAKAAMACQGSPGCWHWTVIRAESRPDSSATATLAWFLQQASRIPEIASEASSAVDRAIRYLMSVTRRNGTVDFSQGDTKDIGVYAMLFSTLPFTQGFCIRLFQAASAREKA